MSEFDRLESWDKLSLEDLLLAYRKAKADCFFEHVSSTAEQFAFYEDDLYNNLSVLLLRLQTEGALPLLREGLGQVRLAAKKLATEKSRSPDSTERPVSHYFFSDPKRTFETLASTFDVIPEFRAVGHFGVPVHIISALWINSVGEKFDGALSESAYGARLRRYKASESNVEAGKYHDESLGSFQPYFTPYKRWRKGGMDALRGELKADRPVIALSLDLANYYHTIDPSFMASEEFRRALKVELSAWQVSFNLEFVQFLLLWSQKVIDELSDLGAATIGVASGGIPIGLAATRIVANVLLAELDRDIESGIAPVFYGRYVDDIFIVMRDPGNLGNAIDVISFLGHRTSFFPAEPITGPVQLQLPESYRGNSLLTLQPTKQKAFFLSGKAGLDLIDSVEAQIRSVSSERRLMPSPERLGSMASAKVLSAAAHPTEEADTIRRADGLSVRRLSWALQLRAVEILARDLRGEDWQTERYEFYRFAKSHILRPDRILDHVDNIPRLLSLAVAMADWSEALSLFTSAVQALTELERVAAKARVNGLETASTSRLWQLATSGVVAVCRDAVIGAIRWDPTTGLPHSLPLSAAKLCELVGLPTDEGQVADLALRLRESDLAKTPYKQHIRLAAQRVRPLRGGDEKIAGCYARIADLYEFLESCRLSPSRVGASRLRRQLEDLPTNLESPIPYIAPTRPYTTQEISLFLPELCVFGNPQTCSSNWARFTRAVRGIWVWGVDPGPAVATRAEGDSGALDGGLIAYLGGGTSVGPVTLGISSLRTTDATWMTLASGGQDLSRSRYRRIEIIVNQAIAAYPRPTYLLLPELSLPERWVDTVSTMLANAGIGLIAGIDYQFPVRGEIHSSAVLVLSDTRLGYSARVEVCQVKTLPAPGEDKRLQSIYGQRWSDLPSAKPVYYHNGFAFGVLVCSELQNVEYRRSFQGDVDALMVLSWNQDLETFASLVESASIDVHASIALVNNREYGDSRVRTPAKKSYDRDLCRLRGGENEHLVVVKIDIAELRSFQSRATRWPEEHDKCGNPPAN